MDVYDQYLNMFSSFNIGWIVILSIAIVVVYVIISIIKHVFFINTVKKAVRDAIKELSMEEINKIKQSDSNNKEGNIKK
jgi:uncharacterized membrane protein